MKLKVNSKHYVLNADCHCSRSATWMCGIMYRLG